MPARNEYYRQCTLTKPSDNGLLRQVTWLPSDVVEKALSEGKPVRIREKGSLPWSDGWTLVHAGPRRDGELVESSSREWAHHRDRTDV